jgi:tetratricopeptide (TPR) repeat protein
MATPPLAKIKAYLGAVKEHLTLAEKNVATATDASTTTTSNSPPILSTISFSVWYFHLLRLEILQRGVWMESEDPTIIIQGVQSTAGKVLLEPSQDNNSKVAGWPVPLLAGCAALTGRVAEILSRCGTHDTNASLEMNLLQSASTRCQEVKDERLRLLLSLYTLHINNNNNNNNAKHVHSAVDSSQTSTRVIWLIVAEGYYYRAATFQPDAPPMWKKLWDLVQERYSLASSTINNTNCSVETDCKGEDYFAIQQLRRIALSKGNTKRASELQWPLMSCLLSLLSPPTSFPFQAVAAYLDCFVAPYRTSLSSATDDAIPPVPPPTGSELFALATTTLDDLRQQQTDLFDSTPEDASLLLPILALQLYEARETALLEKASQEAHTKALRHANTQSKTNTPTPSLKMIQTRVRLDLCLYFHGIDNKCNDDNSFTEMKACHFHITQAIFDVLSLLLTRQEDFASSRHVHEAWTWCNRMLDRQCEQAMTVTRALVKQSQSTPISHMWQAVATQWLCPVLNRIQSDITTLLSQSSESEGKRAYVSGYLDTLSSGQYDFYERALECVPHVEWMFSAANNNDKDRTCLFSTEEFACVERVLSCMIRRLHDQVAIEAKASDTTLGSSPKVRALQSRLYKLQHAHAAVTARVCLCTSSMGNTAIHARIQTVTQTTLQLIARAAKDETDISSSVGSLFLGCMVSWNGWLTPHVPWSFSTLTEARDIVTAAQKEWDLVQANYGCNGTSSIDLERMYLQLAKADAEGPAFLGGMAREAILSYQACLERLEYMDIADKMRTILKSYCKIGVSRVVARDGDVDQRYSLEIAESQAKECVLVLSALDTGNDSLDLWCAAGFAHMTAQRLISLCRQIVADILLQLGRSLEAERYLEDAVREAPEDASASFALGAYRLQRVFTLVDGSNGNKSPELLKAAQIQLLKAAKLDSTRANPFALLGYWYEDAGDAKRAVGCYSKALLLDASNPVAGRGLSRLVTMEDLTRVLDSAINGTFSQAGWAWRIVGLHKALSLGDDDLAIIALLKALRCSDVDRPELNPLSVFYPAPKANHSFSLSEKLEVTTELAQCYRRLGRYTASVRTFHAALEIAVDSPSHSLLCACATGTFYMMGYSNLLNDCSL